jgi:hypothetical protein
MNELDDFLFKSILQAIKNQLNIEKIKSIEQKMQQEHGLKFSDLLNRFDEVKNSLFEFESELKKIEDEVLRDFLTVETADATAEKWLVIKNKYLTEIILKTFADEDKKAILDLTRENAETIPKILVLCNLPNTSGYRKTNQLIEDGFVTPIGLAETFEGKRAILYRSIIQKIQIIINRNSVITKILIPREIVDSSHIVRMITEVIQGRASPSFAN